MPSSALILARFPAPARPLLRLLFVCDVPLASAAARLDLTVAEALRVWRCAVAAVAAR